MCAYHLPEASSSESPGTRGRRKAQDRRPQGAAESRGAAEDRGRGDPGRAHGRRLAPFSAFPVGSPSGRTRNASWGGGSAIMGVRDPNSPEARGAGTQGRGVRPSEVFGHPSAPPPVTPHRRWAGLIPAPRLLRRAPAHGGPQDARNPHLRTQCGTNCPQPPWPPALLAVRLALPAAGKGGGGPTLPLRHVPELQPERCFWAPAAAR